jgi:hypothetical protein
MSLLTEAERKLVSESIHVKELSLVPRRVYTVYGLVFRCSNPWYLILEEEQSEYPVPHYAGFFRIVDPYLPSGFSFQWPQGPWPAGALIPEAWNSPRFFELLLDGDSDAVELFRREKSRIDSQSGRSN